MNASVPIHLEQGTFFTSGDRAYLLPAWKCTGLDRKVVMLHRDFVLGNNLTGRTFGSRRAIWLWARRRQIVRALDAPQVVFWDNHPGPSDHRRRTAWAADYPSRFTCDTLLHDPLKRTDIVVVFPGEPVMVESFTLTGLERIRHVDADNLWCYRGAIVERPDHRLSLYFDPDDQLISIDLTPA